MYKNLHYTIFIGKLKIIITIINASSYLHYSGGTNHTNYFGQTTGAFLECLQLKFCLTITKAEFHDI